ncbi:MAG: thiamine pyrophosphate-dependent enzyme [Methanomicrobiales archaeon]|nr:thiamine pyrophosphate-dependent enzyme [Methanomicrobiales archaeon]
MRGIDAAAWAIRESADRVYAVPGYPLTPLAESLAAELVVNEKAALEYALGDSLTGRRAAVVMKGVGLNACADPLVQATTQGLIAGVVIVAGDDPLAARSTAREDSRYFGELANVPVIEPGVETCLLAVEEAFRASEAFSRVAILRLVPDLLDAVVSGTPSPRRDGRGNLAPTSLTMLGKAQRAEALGPVMAHWSRTCSLNHLVGGTVGVGAAEGDSRVVTVHPPPGCMRDSPEVHEIGRPYFQHHHHLRSSQFEGVPEALADRGFSMTFCRGCPFLPLMHLLKEREMTVVPDAGCAILTMSPPFGIGKVCYGLGSSVCVAARSCGVSLTGDYALLHSGLSGLIDVFEKAIPLLCIVMKNTRMGMTGGHEAYDPVPYLGWASPAICRADDEAALEGLIRPSLAPRVVVVEGTCPVGCRHEALEYRDM